LSHYIEPQNIRQAAFVLDRQALYFPENTIHVVVVDPGVGTRRRPIAAQIGPQRFVGPDNGVFTTAYVRAEREGWPVQIVHTNKPNYWLPHVSDIFHGRDIFSPVAAHWAAGVPLESLGAPIDDPVRISLPRPERTPTGWAGEVVHIDHFGNVISNIHRNDLAQMGNVDVSLCGVTLNGVLRTFGQRSPGELMALYSSNNYLIVSVVNGSGAGRINAKIGDKVVVTPQ
jgi:S-adenosylmethionine hydrolase